MEIKKPVFVLVDPRYVALQQELLHHPELLARLGKTEPRMSAKLECIATYLGVDIDMILSIDEVHRMMELFTTALSKRRITDVRAGGIILPAGTSLH